MYSHDIRQGSFSDFILPFEGKLQEKNRWVKLCSLVPWEGFENLYRNNFSETMGAGSKPARMALGALLLKEHLGCSDEELVEQVSENPYLQYFLGLEEYQYDCPFDSSMMVHFRKRITLEMLNWVNEEILRNTQKNKKKDKDQAPPTESGLAEEEVLPKAEEKPQPNQGKLLMDATCIPADISFPTDLSLLNEAREKTEKILDILYEPLKKEIKKPRTHRQNARKRYLLISKSKKASRAKKRKAVGQQIRYVRRNLKHIETLNQKVSLSKLSKKQYRDLLVLTELLRQQEEMYSSKQSRSDSRIVSITQPHVRPIFRGKARAKTEFGAKISVSLVDGFAFLDRLGWESFNESGDLINQLELYKKRYGYYPKSVHADQIYRNRKNRGYCKERDIRLCGPPLGRPSKSDKALRKQYRKDEKMRVPVEGKFGQAKRRFSLNLVKTKLQNTSECAIGITFVLMNLLKVLFVFFLQPFSRTFMNIKQHLLIILKNQISFQPI